MQNAKSKKVLYCTKIVSLTVEVRPLVQLKFYHHSSTMQLFCGVSFLMSLVDANFDP